MTACMWLTVSQVAALYADHRPDTVYNWIKRGRLGEDGSRLRHGVREIDPEAVERYLKTRDSSHIRKGFRRCAP